MKPILMNTEMVRAILAGRKTVTRRLIKPQPNGKLDLIVGGSNVGKWVDLEDEEYWIPPCHCGDVLYVRETWCENGDYELYPFETEKFWYKADEPDKVPPTPVWFRGWRPSIYMPKEAARIFLRVTGVRVERLQDIEDGWRFAEEGIILYHGMRSEAWRDFADLWDSTIKKADLAKYGWEANPWVWVIEFERISREETLKNA